MPGLKIYSSNKLEVLAQKLAEIIRIPVSGFFAFSPPEIIIVQSKAMEQWISIQIAKRNGICANCIFPFPNAFFDDMVKRFFSDIHEIYLFSPKVMTLKILKILPDLLDKPGFDHLRIYLKDDKNKLRLFQLSEKIADLFDQYMVFRPDFIFSWENNEEKNKKHHNWQAYLWREIIKGNEKQHRSYLQKALIDKLNSLSSDSVKPYGNISVFGISYLPHFHMQLIEELSNIIEVNMFLLNPCKEYWMDIVNNKNAGIIKNKYATNISEEYLHLENGNSLLSSFGELGKTFFNYITSTEHILAEEFDETDAADLLSCIQSDILNLKERKISDNSFMPERPDQSIQFHSCHSQLREMEVLHDNLLSMFEEYPDLMPDDILVMAPDIEIYASFIHTVFGDNEDNIPHIPFSISDRSIKKETGMIGGFLSILELKESRFKVSQVMSVLECPGIKENFGLVESDLEIIRGWLKDTKIRWGIDGTDKIAAGLPGINDNTWKSGIDRLLLGYAMRRNGFNKDGNLFLNILPFNEIEGSNAKILGNFLEFLKKIFELTELLKVPATIERWHMILSGVIDSFFTTDDDIQQNIQVIRKVLVDMQKNAKVSAYDKELEFDIIKYYIRKALENKYSISGFKTGGITFCSMLPMRSIPFKVICLLGMNNDDFPRSSNIYSFDLMAIKPRPGDRSRKNDDKYLFLEGLISAKKIFYLSYIGQSIQDNSSIPPSVLVSELLDYIKNGFGFTQDQMVTCHKLQAFSPDYFKSGTNLFSYSEDNMLTACNLNKYRLKGKDNLPFISSVISIPSDEWKIVNIDSLSNFYANPAKYLLQKRLGIYLEEDEYALSDKEIFLLSGLDNYQINQDLLSDLQAGKSLKYCIDIYKAQGKLPHEIIGNVLFNKSGIDVKNYITKIEAIKKDKILSSLELDIKINDFSLTGKLANYYENGIINFRYAAMKTKDIIKSWIYHLALCSVFNDRQFNTFLLCMDKDIKFKHALNSREILSELFNLYWEGLFAPLHFFPDLSEEYIRHVHFCNNDANKIIGNICNKWSDGYYNRMNSEELYYKLCFGKTDPVDIFNDSFVKISESVFVPMIEHISES